MTASSVPGPSTPSHDAGSAAPFAIDSTEILERLLARMRDRDPSDAPDLAGAISSILAARLEGTPLPDDVQATIDQLDAASPGAAIDPESAS